MPAGRNWLDHPDGNPLKFVMHSAVVLLMQFTLPNAMVAGAEAIQ
jgi:hypothetical protein